MKAEGANHATGANQASSWALVTPMTQNAFHIWMELSLAPSALSSSSFGASEATLRSIAYVYNSERKKERKKERKTPTRNE